MKRIEFESGGAITIARDNHRPRHPIVNVRAVGRSGTVLLFPLSEAEVLALVRALLAGGERASLSEWLDEINALAVTR